MPKLKSHSGAKKRFKKSATGKVISRTCGRIHNMEHKSGSRIRRQSKSHVLSSSFSRKLAVILPD